MAGKSGTKAARKKPAEKLKRANGTGAGTGTTGALNGRQQRTLESHLKKINAAYETIGGSMQSIRDLPFDWSPGFMTSFVASGATGQATPSKPAAGTNRTRAERQQAAA